MTNLTLQQVNSVQELIKFVRKLRIIGLITIDTKRIPMPHLGKPMLYDMNFVSYESNKNKLSADEILSQLIEESERLGLYVGHD